MRVNLRQLPRNKNTQQITKCGHSLVAKHCASNAVSRVRPSVAAPMSSNLITRSTMTSKKKQVRQAFRDAVFTRDGYRCKVCGNSDKETHDAHHITDRTEMPGGGYVKENGITLCPSCHEKAEVFHCTGTALPGWSPDDLYKVIGSNKALAVETSTRRLVGR